jgi:hypothetical protein
MFAAVAAVLAVTAIPGSVSAPSAPRGATSGGRVSTMPVFPKAAAPAAVHRRDRGPGPSLRPNGVPHATVAPNLHGVPNDRLAIGRFGHHAHGDRRGHHRFLAPGFAFGPAEVPYYSYSYDYGPYGYDDDCEVFPQPARGGMMYCDDYRGEMDEY